MRVQMDIERVHTDAKKGEVTITLKWKVSTDLDLHCVVDNEISPKGTEIFYSSFKESKTPCGGMLDVDMIDRSNSKTDCAIENIFWTTAPRGRYTIYVHNCTGSRTTPFELSVLGGGEDEYGRLMIKNWKGLVSPTSGSDRKMKVCDFEFVTKRDKLVWHYERPQP